MAKKVVEMFDRPDGRWQRTPIRGERAYIPETVEELSVLRTRLVAAGHSDAVVNGLVGWLVAKASGDHGSGSSATRYRKILAELDGEVVRSTAA